ncbi:hypothetical protein D3C72_2080060 [compost metagenome]
MNSEPCDRFITSMMPKTSVRPAAMRNSMSPKPAPLSNCSKTSIGFMVRKGLFKWAANDHFNGHWLA